jgi:HEAT repeat protein
MTPCPTCQKPVDPLRAPAARVRDGKVIGYCSKECAAAAETKPTAKIDMPAAAAKPAAPAATPVLAKATPPKGVPASKTTPPKGVPAKRTPPGGVAASAAAYDSGPVIEIVHEPASGVVTSAPDARTAQGSAVSSSRAETSGAIQISETGTADDYIGFDDTPERGRGLLVFLLVLLVLSGGAFAAYHLGYLDKYLPREHGKFVTVVTAPAKRDAGVAPAVDAGVADPAPAALAKARQVLRTQLRSESPRMQRVAAEALARTGDAEAITALAAALAKETADLPKIEIAYALARAGDARGTDALVIALGAPRRDLKAEAARRLALLGDARAVPVLASYLEISQLRLGAAEQLAYLAEPHALEALTKIRTDPDASADDKARATIALGLAGRTEVAADLHKLLDDARFNAFAAAALAAQHDQTAYTLLVKQLEIPSLRVNAARSLRRLDPSLDIAALMPPLITALASKKDTEAVQAAEAVLVLTGPATWSERE